MIKKITVKESIRQQIWSMSNRNLYTITICRYKIGWQDDGDVVYWLRVLSELKRLVNNKIKPI